jgi:hypothetical protein
VTGKPGCFYLGNGSTQTALKKGLRVPKTGRCLIKAMNIDSRDTAATIVHAATAQFDIEDVKIKLFNFPRTAWKIVRTPSG